MKNAILPIVLALLCFAFNVRGRKSFITIRKTIIQRLCVTSFFTSQSFLTCQFKNYSPVLWKISGIFLCMTIFLLKAPPASGMTTPAPVHPVNIPKNARHANSMYYGPAPTSENFDEVTLNNGYSFGNTPRTIGDWTFSLVDNTGANDPNGHLDVTNKTTGTKLANGGNDKALYMNGYYHVAVAAVIKSASGEAFSLTSFEIENGASSSPQFRAIGFLAGTQVISQNFTALLFTQTGSHKIVLIDPKWKNIDEFRIVRQDGSADVSFYIDDIEVGSPSSTSSPTDLRLFKRASSSPTNANTVNYIVAFGTAVAGFTKSNLSLVVSGGITGAAIGTITGSGDTYTVPIITGTGDGSINLNFDNSIGISPGISTRLPFIGQAYWIDKTAPAINIGAPSATTTITGPVTYTVTYTDANPGITSTLDKTDITLNKTGTATGMVAVSGSGTSYTVTISGISGSGTLGISIEAGTAKDAAGNQATAPGASSTFDVIAPVPPVISNLDGDKDYFTEGGLPILLDAGSNATMTDGDSPDFIGGNLTASITGNRAPGEDILGVFVTGPISAPGGGILSFNGNPIGTITIGTGTNDLVAYFTTSDATPAAVQALIRALSYYNSNHTDPSTLDRTISITVNDGDGQTSTVSKVTVSVTGVNDNAPVITSNGGGSTATVSIPENTTAVTIVTATDADGGTTLAFSLTGGADRALFSINATTGKLTFNTAPDFENPADADGDNSYEVTVQVSDGVNTTTQAITVKVTDVNESAPTDAFITTWKTTTANESITIPINPNVSGYNYNVNWGDGHTSTGQTGNAMHIYTNAGTHTVSITGNFPAIEFGGPNSDDANDAKLLTIEQWGTQVWHGMDKAFEGCKSLTTVSSTDAPVFAPYSTLYHMFSGCASFNSNLNNWDLSKVHETSYMFSGTSVFNGNISGWDVSNVTNMNSMFQDATAFNGDISGWQTSSVTDMSDMFNGATSFNQDLNQWDVSNVIIMASMFQGATAFNGNIGKWQPRNVTDMFNMFYGARSFNQDLNQWNVSKVQNMSSMFRGATDFNGDISGWQTSNVTNMSDMFHEATSFNQDIGGWNVSGVANMAGMFQNATAFNQDISDWNVMDVTAMMLMFSRATSFNQNIGHWNVSKVTDMTSMLDNSSLSTANYDSTLIGWAAQNVQSNVNLGATGLTYCKGALARQALIDNHDWTITGDSKAANCGLFIFIAIPQQDTFSLYVFSSDAIQQVKQRIKDSTGIPLAQQQLYFSNQKLEDGRTLADYNIQEMDTLDLQLMSTTKITRQPKDTTVCPAASPSFEVAAIGTNLSYQWQSSTDEGATWGKLSGETSTTLQLSNVHQSDSGTQYRAIAVGAVNTDTSSVAVLRVHLPAQVIEAPQDTTVDWNGTAQFKVVTTGGVTGFQWQSSSDGSTWNNMTGETSATLSLSDVKLADSGMLYRVIVSSPCAAFNTRSATLHVNPPVLTLSPNTLNPAYAHTHYSVTFKANGGTPPYTYQISGDPLPASVHFVNGVLSGQFSAAGNYSIRVRATDNSTGPGTPFKVSKSYSIQVLNTGACMIINSWPSAKTVCEGEEASFTVTGTGITSYQWQSQGIKSSTWQDIAGATGATLTLKKTIASQSGMQYRVVLGSNNCGSLTSGSATLTVRPQTAITTQPTGVTACENGNAVFNVKATGTRLSYQWQVSENGSGWQNVAGGQSDMLHLSSLMSSEDGNRYRIIVSGSCNKDTSGSATLTVHPIKHTTLNKHICYGSSYSFAGQQLSKSGTYYDTLQAKTGCDSVVVLKLTVRPEIKTVLKDTICEGQSYEVGSKSYTQSGTYHDTLTSFTGCDSVVVLQLVVNKKTAIVKQPVDITICAGENAKYTVKAEGTKLQYQWQHSADGASAWTNVTGATKSTLHFTDLAAADNGKKYRVVVTGTCERIISDVVTLTVNPLPEVTITADSTNPVSKGWPVHLTASGADSYKWANGPGIQNGWNEATLTIRPQKEATYTVTGTTEGCSATQSYDVKIIVDYKLICNNIVSPYKDGKNDTWIIRNISSYPNNKVMIFDRAGRMIYEQKNYDNQWDGTLHGNLLKEGTYYYVFIVDGGKKIFKGFIEVLSGKR